MNYSAQEPVAFPQYGDLGRGYIRWEEDLPKEAIIGTQYLFAKVYADRTRNSTEYSYTAVFTLRRVR